MYDLHALIPDPSWRCFIQPFHVCYSSSIINVPHSCDYPHCASDQWSYAETGGDL